IPANNGLSRRDLHSILIGAADRAGTRVRYGTTIDALEDNGTARVGFTDGTTSDYDLVVAFDGINSPLRKRLYGEASNPVYTG
ncbi:2-polyprenyl-6-methoxyphenol hydroxylase, partial [Escherichia coli]